MGQFIYPGAGEWGRARGTIRKRIPTTVSLSQPQPVIFVISWAQQQAQRQNGSKGHRTVHGSILDDHHRQHHHHHLFRISLAPLLPLPEKGNETSERGYSRMRGFSFRTSRRSAIESSRSNHWTCSSGVCILRACMFIRRLGQSVFVCAITARQRRNWKHTLWVRPHWVGSGRVEGCAVLSRHTVQCCAGCNPTESGAFGGAREAKNISRNEIESK